jgi:hypothetical protein
MEQQPKIGRKLQLRPAAVARLALVALLFLAAPISALYLGWPNQWSYLLLALSLGFYAQVRRGAGIWLAAAFLALSAGLVAGNYQGSLLTVLPLLGAAALFLPKGGINQEMFMADSEQQELQPGAIIEARGQLGLVTKIQPEPEVLPMFAEAEKLIPEPLQLDAETYLLAADNRERRHFLAALARRSLLANGALLTLIGYWGLALLTAGLIWVLISVVGLGFIPAVPELRISLLAAPLAVAAFNTFRIYRHLKKLVGVERRRLKIDLNGQLDWPALRAALEGQDDAGGAERPSPAEQ